MSWKSLCLQGSTNLGTYKIPRSQNWLPWCGSWKSSLEAVCAGSECWRLAPEDFCRDPQSWLKGQGRPSFLDAQIKTSSKVTQESLSKGPSPLDTLLLLSPPYINSSLSSHALSNPILLAPLSERILSPATSPPLHSYHVRQCEWLSFLTWINASFLPLPPSVTARVTV